MNAIIGFPKPQVACSIHAGGASAHVYGLFAIQHKSCQYFWFKW